MSESPQKWHTKLTVAAAWHIKRKISVRMVDKLCTNLPLSY